MSNRDLALEFYRINLHGTGWKVESGDFDAAVAMLETNIRNLLKAREFAFAGTLKGLLGRVRAHRKIQTKAA